MPTPSCRSPPSSKNTSRPHRVKGTKSVKGLSVNPRARMSHVAAQKGPCCGTERLPDSLRLCYLPDGMAQTARALSIERGVPAWARFFSDLREVGAIRFLVDGQHCARVTSRLRQAFFPGLSQGIGQRD